MDCAGAVAAAHQQHPVGVRVLPAAERPMASAFLEELRSRLRHATFNAQQLSNLLWSLCIAEVAPCTSLSIESLARLCPWQAAENLLFSMRLWCSHDLFLHKCCSEGKER